MSPSQDKVSTTNYLSSYSNSLNYNQAVINPNSAKNKTQFLLHLLKSVFMGCIRILYKRKQNVYHLSQFLLFYQDFFWYYVLTR